MTVHNIPIMIEDIEPYTELQPKLIDIYERAVNSKDTRSFFTYLYNYLEVINSKSAYQRIASDSLGAYYSENERDDEIMANTPDFANNMNSPSKEFSIEAVKWLTSSLTNERNQSEPFYCWLRINLFYTFRKSSYGQRNQYNNWLTYKATNVMLKNEFTNIFKLNDDKNNHVFKTSLFKFCLEISHPIIMDFINDMREYLQPDSKASSRENIIEVIQAEYTPENDHHIALGIKGRILWLLVNKQYTQKVTRFDSKANYNFKACRELLRRRNSYLDKESMGIAGKSKLTDVLKSAGLKGLLAEHFVDYDKTNNKIRLLDNVSITHEDLANLIKFVKDNFQKDSDSSDS